MHSQRKVGSLRCIVIYVKAHFINALDLSNIMNLSFNESFHQCLESVQYNGAIGITGAIRGASSEKRFQELGLEILKSNF